MLLIPCPWCGPRDESEFSYGGDAERVMPPLEGNANQADWQAFVHCRENQKGKHREFWYHGFGCEQWIVVERDTVTHEISQAIPAVTNKEPGHDT